MRTTTLIRNVKLFTGSKNEPAEIRDVLIRDGVIAEISGSIEPESDWRVIDATGKWVVPGFIDSHTHYDAELIAAPGLNESARHGVTSVILGSCSVSAVYNDPEATSDCFTRVEAIPREVMLPLLEREKTWDSPQSWIDYIEKLPLGINVASFLGHSDLRVKVLGMERALQHTLASPAEQAKMDELLNEALDAGFLGLSTMDNPWDKMDGDKYWSHKTPSFYASWKERKRLINTLRRRGGILQGAPNLVTRVNAVRYMAASAGIFRKPLRTTMIALMDLMADRYIFPLVGFASRVFNGVLNANFRMQSPPCPFTVYYDGVDSVMFEEFPSGEAMRHLAKNLDERNALIKDPGFRQKFKKEISNKFAPKVWHRDLSMAVITDSPDKSMVGRNFYDIAVEKREHPVETFLDLIVEYDKEIRWTTTIANDRVDKYGRLYNHAHNLISFSDAGAHLNNMAFYDFPLQMIRHVWNSQKAGKPIMSMEKCIWRLTGELADWFGLDCGYIRKGKRADLAILDPEMFGNITDKVEDAAIEEFNGYRRLVNRHAGVVANVLVGGEMIFEDGKFVEGYGKDRKYGAYLRGEHLQQG